MVNLSVRKWVYSKALNEQLNFSRMLLLATIIHLLLLFFLDVEIPPHQSTQKIITSMLDVTLNSPANHKESMAEFSAMQQNNQPSDLIGTIMSFQENLHSSTQVSQEKLLGSLQQNALKPSQPSNKQQHISPPDTRKRTISAASHESKDAAYLARWQSYVEEFGNLHYPQEILKNNLRGELRLLVAVKKDGTVHEVSIRQSSGYLALDQAAIEIVYNAAPFEPLPDDVADDIEVLEIIRTWQFRGKLSTSV